MWDGVTHASHDTKMTLRDCLVTARRVAVEYSGVMKILLVNPLFPYTYWGFQLGLRLAGRDVSLPPLGLITMAASLPPEWTLRLIDLNAESLRDRDLRWADAVLVGGMRVQAASMHSVIERAAAFGCRTVVGGPAPTTSPQEYGDADVVFQGEVEGRAGVLAEAIGATGPKMVVPPPENSPQMSEAPVPRFDLLELDRYASMCIQYSRGCPFRCEFCDIIEIYGRVPRVKSVEQVITELDGLYRTGYRGPLFFVDDNFIGNRREVRKLLPALARWQADRGRPFGLYTEASVNLAVDDKLLEGMVAAGFTAVFLGIETPSEAALAGAGKTQNLGVDLDLAVERITGYGLEVMGGFIAGFDQDAPDVFERMRAFICSLPIPLAMVGLLTALPETALHRRLAREGRLRGKSSGDAFGRPNFEPVMDELALLRGYRGLLQSLYDPAAYFERCRRYVERAPPPPGRRQIGWHEIVVCVRIITHIGVARPWRHHFWRLLLRTLRHAPHHATWVMEKAVQGEHMIRYTTEWVLPRLDEAIRELEAERAACEREIDLGVEPSRSRHLTGISGLVPQAPESVPMIDLPPSPSQHRDAGERHAS